MCESKDKIFIQIEEKTQEYKYEFISSYIPLWNSIICGRGRRKRAIIDTHAGTGKVILENQEEFGSSLLFLQKTALKQEALKFYFCENDKKHCNSLEESIEEKSDIGFFFPGDHEKIIEVVIKKGIPYQVVRPKYQPITKYPNLDQIKIYNQDCLDVIDEILEEIKNRPAFFFIDPCGKFLFKLIEKIVNKRLLDKIGNPILNDEGGKLQGTELLISFSWEAISRFSPEKRDKKSKDKFFLEMFGMDWDKVEKELSKIRKEFIYSKRRFSKYDLYLEVYKNQLKRYFDYVSEISIPGIKSEKNPIYAMIFCTSNKIAVKLFENKAIELGKLRKQYLWLRSQSPNPKDYKYQDLKNFKKENRSIDEFLN